MIGDGATTWVSALRDVIKYNRAIEISLRTVPLGQQCSRHDSFPCTRYSGFSRCFNPAQVQVFTYDLRSTIGDI